MLAFLPPVLWVPDLPLADKPAYDQAFSTPTASTSAVRRGERQMPEGGNVQPRGRSAAFGEDTEGDCGHLPQEICSPS